MLHLRKDCLTKYVVIEAEIYEFLIRANLNFANREAYEVEILKAELDKYHTFCPKSLLK